MLSYIPTKTNGYVAIDGPDISISLVTRHKHSVGRHRLRRHHYKETNGIGRDTPPFT